MKSVGCQTGIKYESNLGEETRTLENNTKEVDSFQSVKDGDATLQYIAVKLEADDVDQLLSSTDWASEGETETISDVEIFAPFESRGESHSSDSEVYGYFAACQYDMNLGELVCRN